jgi:hypothetical protein
MAIAIQAHRNAAKVRRCGAEDTAGGPCDLTPAVCSMIELAASLIEPAEDWK